MRSGSQQSIRDVVYLATSTKYITGNRHGLGNAIWRGGPLERIVAPWPRISVCAAQLAKTVAGTQDESHIHKLRRTK